MKTKAVILLFVIFLLCGCVFDNDKNKVENTPNIYRYTDADAGVVCWVFDAYYRGGIDCMPIDQTLLDTGE